MDIWIIALFLAFTGLTASVEVHFETPDSGFFLKHSPRQSLSATSDMSNSQSKSKTDQDSILSIDKFTIVQTSQPVSIRASYGPFSTKQTVPARYIVPDVMETASDSIQNTTVALLDMQQTNLHLDISAHLVQSSIPRDSPVLRVLFHAGADPGGHMQRQKICVLLHVALGSRTPLKGRCMPEGEDGVCVAEVIIPSNWWPPLPAPEKEGRLSSPQKTPQRMVQVSYSVFEPPARSPEQCEPKVQIQPLTPFARIPLTQAMTAYKELRADDLLTLLVPNQPLYPLSKIHVPVFLQQQPDQNIAVFIVRARVKAGMKILGATASSEEWNVSVEKENSKHTVARVTAFRKDRDPDSTVKEDDSSKTNKIVEVFSWLLEVANDTKEHWDGGRIVWSVSYVHDGPKLKQPTSSTEHDEHRKKLVAKVEIQKDEIQKVLPISKNWEVMNTAVLTGRQVSQAMKVFIVSQAGKVADVTLQSSCTVEDESVIKVSSSCSSVYVDGSEARGSSNASVVVKYGTYIGLARFTVWMPEFPLEVSVADFRLSQIKGWRIPDDHNSLHGKSHRKKRAYGWSQNSDDFSNGLGGERSTCRARYQQSPVEIFAKFLAVDQDSGRVSYLISRRTALRVTDLVQPLLRVADPKIATLKGRILQGRAMGRTDVQVLSPITGRVIGAKEIRVGSDKVSIVKLLVRVVSGLQLTIATDNAIENGYIAETSVTRRLTAQYQEGLLDIDLEFTDGSRTPLRDIAVDDYFLLVESLDTDVVAFAPMLASHHPRVIAVGEGNGDLLRVTLLLSEECRLRRNIPVSKQGPKSSVGPLASALASVQVDFSTTDSPNTRPDTVQNDGFSGRERKGGNSMNDLTDILIGIPLKDDTNHEPTVQARQHRGGVGGISHIGVAGLGNNKSLVHHDMTSMEIGMYILLTAFCLAIAVFVVSCVVYASKFRPVVTIDQLVSPTKDRYTGALSHLSREPRNIKESTTNAHDWVWLGRASIDRSSIAHDAASNVTQRDSRIRITSNPIMSYSVQDETTTKNGFEISHQNQMPLSKSAGHVIDTSTYNKNDKRLREIMEAELPPPLPPHGPVIVECSRNFEYKPPVPPHRNVGVTANLNDHEGSHKRSLPEITEAPGKKHHHHHHNRPSRNGNIQNRRSCGNDIQIHNAPAQENQNASQRNLNFTQQQIHAALFNVSSSSVPQYTVQPINNDLLNRRSIKSPSSPSTSLTCNTHNEYELHMAERLVENAVQQQKTAFKFDTITPKKINETDDNNTPSAMHSTPVQENTTEVKLRQKGVTAQNKTQTMESSSDDNGGFVTPPGEHRSDSQVKRATVVGNPMFSSSPDSDLGPNETLGLDDLDMDYEQIMHYFDNLKESNA